MPTAPKHIRFSGQLYRLVLNEEEERDLSEGSTGPTNWKQVPHGMHNSDHLYPFPLKMQHRGRTEASLIRDTWKRRYKKTNLTVGEGFEPPVLNGTTVFGTAALNHSANLPTKRKNMKRVRAAGNIAQTFAAIEQSKQALQSAIGQLVGDIRALGYEDIESNVRTLHRSVDTKLGADISTLRLLLEERAHEAKQEGTAAPAEKAAKYVRYGGLLYEHASEAELQKMLGEGAGAAAGDNKKINDALSESRKMYKGDRHSKKKEKGINPDALDGGLPNGGDGDGNGGGNGGGGNGG